MKHSLSTSRKILLAGAMIGGLCAYSPSANAQAVAAATTYNVTINRVELCTEATCTLPITVGSGTTQFDISSATVGAALGSYATLEAVPKGTTITHVRVTLSRSIGIAGSTADPGNVGGTCGTDSTDNTSAVTAAGIGIVGGGGTTQTLVVPDEGSIAGNPPGGTYAAQDVTLTSATEMQILKALPGPFIMEDEPPVVDIAFETAAGLQAFDSNGGVAGGGCLMLPGAPVVSITKR